MATTTETTGATGTAAPLDREARADALERGGAGGGQGPAARPVGLGPLGWGRWAWRQLTSMRTALLLLMLLAVAAVPGSLFPQRSIDAVRVSDYLQAHPVAAPWLDRLGFFDVYASPWFSAIYLLLFISLVGCVLPRARVHLRALRQPPPRTPARLERLPEHRTATVAADPERVLAAARTALRARRYRVADHPGSVAAQRGELRETGNLVFHLSLIGVLVAVAIGGLWGYRAQKIVVVGQSFSNISARYDTYEPGTLVDPDDLPPFAFLLRSVQVVFDDSTAGNQFGAPRSFTADVTTTSAPGAAPVDGMIRVNEPLRVDGVSVYLAGNGYAPHLVVRDATGTVVMDAATPFLVQDSNYTSTGVVKVAGSQPEQIGLQGIFAPTATVDPVLGPVSTFPDARDPELFLTAWAGDLGFNQGQSQNVYELDTDGMRQLQGADGTPLRLALKVGETAQLPDGLGSVTFTGVDRYAGLTLRHDPARGAALVFSLLSIAGLTASLFVARRRVWVRAVALPGGGSTLVVGALARSEDPGLAAEADAVLAATTTALAGAPTQPTEPTDPPDDPPAAPARRSTP